MTIKEIKGSARENLLPYLGISVVITLIATLLKNVISLLASLPIAGTGFLSFFTYEIAFFISSLLIGILQAGISKYYLTMSTIKGINPFDLFYGFSHTPDKILIITLITTVLKALCTLPYAIYTSFFMTTVSQATTMDSLLTIAFLSLIGEVLSFLVTIPFALSYFVYVDMPELTPFKTLKMSCYLMKNRFASYIGYNLSFLPLMFASLLTLGIGNFWLEPYMNAGMAEFYLDATTRKSK